MVDEVSTSGCPGSGPDDPGSMSDAGTVFLVDDDPAVLAALGRLLRSAGYHAMAFASAREFMDGGTIRATAASCSTSTCPDSMASICSARWLRRGSALRIVFLTEAADFSLGVPAMKGGAADFLTKPVDDKVLLDAVGAAVERSRVEGKARARIREILQRLDTLTPREREVLPLIVAGRMNKQAAAELGTSEKTIKIHRARVMTKMGARTLPDLVRLAERAGFHCPSAGARSAVCEVLACRRRQAANMLASLAASNAVVVGLGLRRPGGREGHKASRAGDDGEVVDTSAGGVRCRFQSAAPSRRSCCWPSRRAAWHRRTRRTSDRTRCRTRGRSAACRRRRCR